MTSEANGHYSATLYRIGQMLDEDDTHGAFGVLLEEMGVGKSMAEEALRAINDLRDATKKAHAEHSKALSDIAESIGLMMASNVRIERGIDESKRNNEQVRAMAALALQRLDGADLEWVRRELLAIKKRNDRIDAADAVARAKLEAKVEFLEKRTDELHEDVEDTQRREVAAAVARAKELESHASHHDLELVKEDRADKRETKRWALGLVGAVVLAVLSAVLGHQAHRFTYQPEFHAPESGQHH
jgi:hypothetical protein